VAPTIEHVVGSASLTPAMTGRRSGELTASSFERPAAGSRRFAVRVRGITAQLSLFVFAKRNT